MAKIKKKNFGTAKVYLHPILLCFVYLQVILLLSVNNKSNFRCTSRSQNLDTRIIDPCNTTVLAIAKRMCSPLLSNQGAVDIFMSCRCAGIDPSIFYNRCIFDICQVSISSTFYARFFADILRSKIMKPKWNKRKAAQFALIQ